MRTDWSWPWAGSYLKVWTNLRVDVSRPHSLPTTQWIRSRHQQKQIKITATGVSLRTKQHTPKELMGSIGNCRNISFQSRCFLLGGGNWVSVTPSLSLPPPPPKEGDLADWSARKINQATSFLFLGGSCLQTAGILFPTHHPQHHSLPTPHFQY